MFVLVVTSFGLVFLLCLRVIVVCLKVYKNRNVTSIFVNKKCNIKTCVVVGAGGHAAEMMRLLSAVDKKVYLPRQYFVATSDLISEQKIRSLERETFASSSNEYIIETIPRSREVKQSWLTSIYTTAVATMYVFPILLRSRPDLVLCNGPGTCIPICLWSFLFKVLWIKNTTIVYVESICRVQSLSLSAKILYYFADHILVQWPQLCARYPHTRYIGRLV